MLSDFFLPALAVAVSELGDKTQLAVFSLSSKYKNKLFLFCAVMLAFFLVDGIAVIFGSFANKLVPISIIRIVAGILFVGYGCYTLIMKDDSDSKSVGKAAFFSIVSMIFLLELGDKTQIATILFASQYNPFLVFLGIEVALAAVTIAAIFVGAHVMKFIRKDILKLSSGILFIAIGIWSLIG